VFRLQPLRSICRIRIEGKGALYRRVQQQRETIPNFCPLRDRVRKRHLKLKRLGLNDRRDRRRLWHNQAYKGCRQEAGVIGLFPNQALNAGPAIAATAPITATIIADLGLSGRWL